MAKTPKFPKEPITTPKNRHQALDRALQQIERAYGKGAIMMMDGESSACRDAISSGALSLDMALGGYGIPRGRIVEIYGPESSGKTTLALNVVASAQKADGVAAFVDVEHALDPVWMKRNGVNIENLLVSQPDGGEQALEITDMLVRSNAVDVIVVDSVAALIPKAELEGDMGDTHVGHLARLMSQAMRKLTAAIAKSKSYRHLHQPDSREDRRDVRQPRDNPRWPRAEVLQLRPDRRTPHRLDQGRRPRDGQPSPCPCR